MSKQEADLVENEADKLGLSVSAYIRMLIHKEEKKWDSSDINNLIREKPVKTEKTRPVRNGKA